MPLKKTLSVLVACCFCVQVLYSPSAQAQTLLGLPEPGQMVSLSPTYDPVLLKGLTIHPDNPFVFDFIVDQGQDHAQGKALKEEGQKLIKYFLASLAIPEQDLWVNLSPYEKNRTVPKALGQTGMGRDLLAEDYMLKQITASLVYPQHALGKQFWQRLYKQLGTDTNYQVPVNLFNKVWIVADKAEVYEHGQTALVASSHLKVMLEEDYRAFRKNSKAISHSGASDIIRQIILPKVEHEVNYGKNFAQLRQITNALILASWYKNNLKHAILNQVYADKEKTIGINLKDPSVNQQIFERYLEAYKKGVFNFIKEDDANGPGARKYFSGGWDPAMAAHPSVTHDPASLSILPSERLANIETGFYPTQTGDRAMSEAVDEPPPSNLQRFPHEKVDSRRATVYEGVAPFRKTVSEAIAVALEHRTAEEVLSAFVDEVNDLSSAIDEASERGLHWDERINYLDKRYVFALVNELQELQKHRNLTPEQIQGWLLAKEFEVMYGIISKVNVQIENMEPGRQRQVAIDEYMGLLGLTPFADSVEQMRSDIIQFLRRGRFPSSEELGMALDHQQQKVLVKLLRSFSFYAARPVAVQDASFIFQRETQIALDIIGLNFGMSTDGAMWAMPKTTLDPSAYRDLWIFPGLEWALRRFISFEKDDPGTLERETRIMKVKHVDAHNVGRIQALLEDLQTTAKSVWIRKEAARLLEAVNGYSNFLRFQIWAYGLMLDALEHPMISSKEHLVLFNFGRLLGADAIKFVDVEEASWYREWISHYIQGLIRRAAPTYKFYRQPYLGTNTYVDAGIKPADTGALTLAALKRAIEEDLRTANGALNQVDQGIRVEQERVDAAQVAERISAQVDALLEKINAQNFPPTLKQILASERMQRLFGWILQGYFGQNDARETIESIVRQETPIQKGIEPNAQVSPITRRQLGTLMDLIHQHMDAAMQAAPEQMVQQVRQRFPFLTDYILNMMVMLLVQKKAYSIDAAHPIWGAHERFTPQNSAVRSRGGFINLVPRSHEKQRVRLFTPENFLQAFISLNTIDALGLFRQLNEQLNVVSSEEIMRISIEGRIPAAGGPNAVAVAQQIVPLAKALQEKTQGEKPKSAFVSLRLPQDMEQLAGYYLDRGHYAGGPIKVAFEVWGSPPDKVYAFTQSSFAELMADLFVLNPAVGLKMFEVLKNEFLPSAQASTQAAAQAVQEQANGFAPQFILIHTIRNRRAAHGTLLRRGQGNGVNIFHGSPLVSPHNGRSTKSNGHGQATDAAMNNGGIDLNGKNIEWTLHKDGRGVEMNIDAAMVERIKRQGLQGLIPVILRITPVASIWPILGMNPPQSASS